MAKQEPIERARDELFSHIHRCGVLDANADDQDVWMNETVEYLGERYPELQVNDLVRLKAVGMQFCKPVISRLKRRSQQPDPPETDSEAILGEPREA